MHYHNIVNLCTLRVNDNFITILSVSMHFIRHNDNAAENNME